MMKLRRTMMFVPGNNAGMIKDAHIYHADSLMFDLEDSVAVASKDQARFLVYEALRSIDYEGAEIVVRINGLDTPFGHDDIEAVVRAGAHIIRLPKTDSAQDLKDVETIVAQVEKKCGRKDKTMLLAAVEGPQGVLNAYEIATASDRLVGIALGAEDYVRSMKTSRSKSGDELFLARSMIVTAARAAGIQAFDTVFSNVEDEEGLIRETELIKSLGFDGKSVINPRQIPVVHKLFTPTDAEINQARRIIAAIGEAEQKGSGVVSLDGKMIDKPVVERAERTLQLAKASGVIRADEVAL